MFRFNYANSDSMSPRRAQKVIDLGGDPAAELREHLIDTAERLLSEHEIATITTRDIARAAGVSGGVLYNHFANKEDLMLNALVRRFRRLLSTYRSAVAVAAVGTVEEGLAVYARAAFDLHTDALPMVAAMLSEPPLFYRFLEEIHRPPLGGAQIRDPLVEFVTNERAAGRVGAVDPDAATDLLLGAMILLALTRYIGAISSDDVEARCRAIVETLVYGLDRSEAL